MSIWETVSLFLWLTTVLSGTALPSEQNYEYYKDQADDYHYEDYEDGVQDDVDGQSREQNNSFRPQIISQPAHLVVDNGMTISLPCMVDRTGGNTIMWQKLDSKKTIIAVGERVIDPGLAARASVSVTERGSTLIIGAANNEDAGQYKCEVAIQGNPPELKHTVSIRAPPSISSSSPASITVEKGQDVTLNCKGMGMPKPSVKWTRVGQKMPDGSDDVKSDVITFKEVTRKHAGIYKCTASNGHVNGATKQIEVFVRYVPVIKESEMFVHKSAGDSAELVCSVHAFPPATVTWKKGSSAVRQNERVSITHRGGRHTLNFNKVDSSDFSEYSCHASNELGETRSSTIELSGHAKPAKFKSDPTGDEENNFKIEWTSFSLSPIEEFLLETSSYSGTWTSHTPTPPTQESPFLWAGKFYIKGLLPATQYTARVTVRNGEGWGKPGPGWNFATKGAEPSLHSDSNSLPKSHIMFTSMLCLLSLYHWFYQ